MDTASVVCPGSVPPITTIFPGTDSPASSSAVSGTLSGISPKANPSSCAFSLVAPIPMMSNWYVEPPSSFPVEA